MSGSAIRKQNSCQGRDSWLHPCAKNSPLTLYIKFGSSLFKGLRNLGQRPNNSYMTQSPALHPQCTELMTLYIKFGSSLFKGLRDLGQRPNISYMTQSPALHPQCTGLLTLYIKFGSSLFKCLRGLRQRPNNSYMTQSPALHPQCTGLLTLYIKFGSSLFKGLRGLGQRPNVPLSNRLLFPKGEKSDCEGGKAQNSHAEDAHAQVEPIA